MNLTYDIQHTYQDHGDITVDADGLLWFPTDVGQIYPFTLVITAHGVYNTVVIDYPGAITVEGYCQQLPTMWDDTNIDAMLIYTASKPPAGSFVIAGGILGLECTNVAYSISGTGFTNGWITFEPSTMTITYPTVQDVTYYFTLIAYVTGNYGEFTETYDFTVIVQRDCAEIDILGALGNHTVEPDGGPAEYSIFGDITFQDPCLMMQLELISETDLNGVAYLTWNSVTEVITYPTDAIATYTFTVRATAQSLTATAVRDFVGELIVPDYCKESDIIFTDFQAHVVTGEEPSGVFNVNNIYATGGCSTLVLSMVDQSGGVLSYNSFT